jgi:hypothetical protein
LREKVVAAEEAIYADAADPLVVWDEGDLRATLEAAGLADVRLTGETQAEERLITAAHLERWFGGKDPLSGPLPGGEGTGGRLSYRERLLAGGLSAAEAERVERLFRKQLAEQTVTWASRVVYVRAEK